MDDVRAIVEALVFASDAPLSVERLKDILGDMDRKAILEILQDIELEYRQRSGGLCLMEVAGGYQFRTKTDYAPWIKKLRGIRPVPISPAAMETLSVVAYRQPVTRPEIDGLRGVESDAVLRSLMVRGLVEPVGRRSTVGLPIEYSTTFLFLEYFGLSSLEDLPPVSPPLGTGESPPDHDPDHDA